MSWNTYIKYTLNGVHEYPAPTRVLRNAAIKSPLRFLSKLFVRSVLAGFIANITGSVAAGYIAYFSDHLDEAKFQPFRRLFQLLEVTVLEFQVMNH